MDDDGSWDIDFDRSPCPVCGSDDVRTRSCDVIGCEDGQIDEYDDDPINFAPGEEYTTCQECYGFGYLCWCAKCGCDLNRIEKHREQA